MDRVYLTILGFVMDGGGILHVQSTMQSNWGVQVSEGDLIPADNDPATLLAMAKGMVIAWAADPVNGGKTLTEDQVIVVGGIQ